MNGLIPFVLIHSEQELLYCSLSQWYSPWYFPYTMNIWSAFLEFETTFFYLARYLIVTGFCNDPNNPLLMICFQRQWWPSRSVSPELLCGMKASMTLRLVLPLLGEFLPLSEAENVVGLGLDFLGSVQALLLTGWLLNFSFQFHHL